MVWGIAYEPDRKLKKYFNKFKMVFKMKKKALSALLGLVISSCLSYNSFASCCNGNNGNNGQGDSAAVSDSRSKSKSCVYSNGSASLSLQGSFDFKFGYVDSKPKISKARYLSPNVKDYAFDSSAHVNLIAEYKPDNYEDNVAYGANIGIGITALNNRKSPSYLYIKSDKLGKLELGSGKTANAQMKVDGSSIAVGAAVSFDAWGNADPRKTNLYYVSNMGSYIDQKSRNSDRVEYARKITYFTPNISGLQFGISFVPDTSNSGSAKFSNCDDHDILGKIIGYKFGIKNAISYAASYERNINEDVKFKLMTSGENGTPIGKFVKKGAVDPKYKFNKLAAYSFGGQISVGSFDFAAGYQDQGKSLAPKEVKQFSGSSSLYSVGTRYTYDAIRASLFYFSSDVFKNKMDAVVFDVDYKLLPGILPYAEVGHFNTKGKYFADDNVENKDKSSGMVYIVGVKIEV